MKDRKKLFLMIFGVILGIIIVVAGTYAWFKWRSSSSINFNVTIDNSTGLTITFNGGSNVTGTIEPTLTKEEGVVKNFSAYTNGVNVPMNIWLQLNSLPNDLKDSTFKWELYKDGILLTSSSFSTSDIATRTNNNTTDYYLVMADTVGSTTVNYTLYLWIDGNLANNGNMAGKSIDFDLYGTVTNN